MAHEADTPAKTLERLRDLVLEQLKPDSAVSAVDAYYGMVDLLVTWEVADDNGRLVSSDKLPTG